MNVNYELLEQSEGVETYSKVGELALRCSVRTDIGQKRQENQDSFGVTLIPDNSTFLIADGMGGAVGGKTASQMCANLMAQAVAEEKLTPEKLGKCVERVNSDIYSFSRKQELLRGMGSTLVCLSISNERAFFANIGDSRLYLLRNSEFRQLSLDHTFGEELIRTEAIEQPINKSMGQMLTRVIGPSEQVKIDVTELSGHIQLGDIYLLCCDGLSNYVSDEQVAEVLIRRSPSTATQELINLANAGGGSDNITVAVIHVENFNNDSIFTPFGIHVSGDEEYPELVSKPQAEPEPKKNKTTRKKENLDEVIQEKLPHGAAYWPKPTVEPKPSSATYIRQSAPLALIYGALIILVVSVYVSSDIILDKRHGTSTNTTVRPLEVSEGLQTPTDRELNEKPLSAAEKALIEELLMLAECKNSGNCQYSLEELENRIEQKNQELESL